VKTATKGNGAEAMIMAALVARGFNVLVPWGGGQPYDLGVDLGGSDLLKIQCKTGWPEKNCITFNTRSTDHGQGRRSYVGLAHIFGVYFPPLKSLYLVPLDAVGNFRAYLRLKPARNNQKRKINFASDFEIERWNIESLREVQEEASLTPEPELNFA
jgi:PD-(D/E)XK endonuclease